MINPKNLRQRYWLYAGLWTAFLYSTLYIARPIINFLKANIPFTATVNIFVYTILLVVIIGLCFKLKVRSLKTYAMLLALCAAYYYGFTLAQNVEEKIHFVQYGFLAFLVFRAVHLDFPRMPAAWIALLITSLVGWGDEGIQFLLPNRYYEWNDVLLNFLGGALGLWMTLLLSKPLLNRHSERSPVPYDTGRSRRMTWRNIVITLFIVIYSLTFHYESTRHFYLNALFKKELPKVKYLFPPAGWIMFYQVGEQYGFTEVYGLKGEDSYRIDPHEIFRVRTIGFDNIHRGILGAVSYRERAQSFCGHLKRRFDFFDEFLIVTQHYPSFVDQPYDRREYVRYKCVY